MLQSLNVVVLSLSSQCSINIEFLPSFHHSSSLTSVNQSARVCLCVSAWICAQPDRQCGLTLPNQYLPDVNFFLSWNNLIFMINDQGGYVIHSVLTFCSQRGNMTNALWEPSILRNNFYLMAHNLLFFSLKSAALHGLIKRMEPLWLILLSSGFIASTPGSK